jgi:hypothetical protein
MDGEEEVAPEPCAKTDPAQSAKRGRIMKPFLIGFTSLLLCPGILRFPFPSPCAAASYNQIRIAIVTGDFLYQRRVIVLGVSPFILLKQPEGFLNVY